MREFEVSAIPRPANRASRKRGRTGLAFVLAMAFAAPANASEYFSAFEGQLKDGKPWNGQGTVTFPDGSRYEGQWKDGKRAE